ncbi:hypothetical protein TrispH2_005869 [Trichoplax sp. H2]|uniref:Uncharacterized protein n=1 Tax=Trichoplax adhaerens TaxID=10228 RepID=B3RYL3_TRIAD|nr:predicted protein [Trichoplax adhaerens]EDV24616.1 predicted protein [Trichoplax adhaerens]RDD42305.1 hypothetical protein TrispH2_005869 [Trichoplax sp. H2]|eukprot:XP_002112506.1 predicted protein [Trichoplax adhaerens]
MHRQNYPLSVSAGGRRSHGPLVLCGERCHVRRKASTHRTKSELTTTTLNLSQNVLRSTRGKVKEEQDRNGGLNDSMQNEEIYVKALVNKIDEMLAESSPRDTFKSNQINFNVNESNQIDNTIINSSEFTTTPSVCGYNKTSYTDTDIKSISNFSNEEYTSPYEGILTKLKLKQLKLEESSLLKRKEIIEKEMNRPPKSKWYESKGIDFHVESRLNSSRLSKSLDSGTTNNSTLLAYSQDFI